MEVKIGDDLTRSFKEAIKNAHSSKDANLRVILEPKTYRESLDFEAKGLNIEIIGNGAKISGAQQLANWLPFRDNKVWEHVWHHGWGVQPQPWSSWGVQLPELQRRREVLILDGELLRPAASLDDCINSEYHHWTDDDKGKMYANMPGYKPTSIVEAGVRQKVYYSAGHNTMYMENLEFYGSSSLGSSAVKIQARGSHGNHLQNVTVRHCNSQGLKMSNGRNWRLYSVKALYNGWNGTSSWALDGLGAYDCVHVGNGWRTKGPGVGNKHHHARGGHLWVNLVAKDNASHGVWYDRDGQDTVTILGGVFDNNEHRGVMYEGGGGSYRITGARITNTRKASSNAGAMFASAIAKLHIEGCEIADNDKAQIGVFRRKRDNLPSLGDPDVKQTVRMTDVVIVNNTLRGPKPLNLATMPYDRLVIEGNTGL